MNCFRERPFRKLDKRRKDRKLERLGNLPDRQVTKNLSREGRLVRPPAKEKEKSKPLKVVKGRSFAARTSIYINHSPCYGEIEISLKRKRKEKIGSVFPNGNGKIRLGDVFYIHYVLENI